MAPTARLAGPDTAPANVTSVWVASSAPTLAISDGGKVIQMVAVVEKPRRAIARDNLTPFAAEHLSFMNPSFGEMATPALIVAGDHDQSPLSTRGPDWWNDAYHLSPGSKSLLTLFGAEHSLGGIPGYGVTETTDESPERVARLQRLTLAYLRGAVDPADNSWAELRAKLLDVPHPLGKVESK